MRISLSGSVRFRPEQISAVTDSVPEHRQPDHTITTADCEVSLLLLNLFDRVCQFVLKMAMFIMTGVVRHYRHQFQKAIAGAGDVELLWRRHEPESCPTVTERYSHSACYCDKSVYVFGGIVCVCDITGLLLD